MKPKLDVDQHFKEITAFILADGLMESVEGQSDRITVMVHLPYLKEYGKPQTLELVYGCRFPVAVGSSVLCPPTPRGDGSWVNGVVVSLDGSGYDGPVKYVRKISDPKG